MGERRDSCSAAASALRRQVLRSCDVVLYDRLVPDEAWTMGSHGIPWDTVGYRGSQLPLVGLLLLACCSFKISRCWVWIQFISAADGLKVPRSHILPYLILEPIFSSSRNFSGCCP